MEQLTEPEISTLRAVFTNKPYAVTLFRSATHKLQYGAVMQIPHSPVQWRENHRALERYIKHYMAACEKGDAAFKHHMGKFVLNSHKFGGLSDETRSLILAFQAVMADFERQARKVNDD